MKYSETKGSLILKIGGLMSLLLSTMPGAFTGTANAQTTLFDDTYSRGGTNSAGDLTPNFIGETGADVGAGITYITFTNSFNTIPPNSLNIQNGTLFKSQTGQEGVWALDYNFTDAAILAAGGFSVSQNILAVPSNANQPQDRFCGYGVGLSLAQVNNLNDDNATSSGPRGSITGGTTGVAPFYVDLDSQGAVQVFTGGTLLSTVAITGSPTNGTLRTEFTGFSNFNAGTTVDFTVYFNGLQVTNGSFTWSSAESDYLAGSMRDSTITAGELNVTTISEQAMGPILAHRYSFNEPAGTTAGGSATTIIDSVGSANGTFYGVGDFTGTELTLPGVFYPNADGTHNTNNTGFVQLPTNMISSLPANGASFEFWITWQGGPIWQEFMSFGEAAQPGLQLGGGHYLMICPNDDDNLLHAEWFGVPGSVVLTAPELPSGVESHVVLTHDQVLQRDVLYVNGQIVASAPTTATLAELAPDPDEWLGCDQWQDPCFNGGYQEFRIWNGPLTAAQVQASYESGPSNVSINAGSLVSIQFANSSNAVLGGILSPSILGTYASLTNQVNVTSQAGITYSSGDTNVINFGTDGNFHALAVGSATLQAAYQSQTASITVTVSPQPVLLQHRYSFDGPEGSTVITDSIAGFNGTLIFGSSTAELNGSGQLLLDGDLSAAYVSLPSGILSTLTNATFEVWVDFAGGPVWQELISLGTNNGASGIDYTTIIPHNGANGKLRWGINEGGEVDIDGPSELETNAEVCVAVSYNYSAQSASIYVNGRKVGSGAMSKALYTISDVDNYIGRSQFYSDPYFEGSIDEVRIYSGSESDLQAAIDAAAGPNTILTNPGALVSVNVTGSSTVDAHGVGSPIFVIANYADVTNVDVTALATITTSDPTVATLVNGNVFPQNAGTATFTASFAGIKGTLPVTVTDTNGWPSLVHHYPFHDPAGSSTISDTAGSINGTLEGAAVLTGTQLVMPSPNPVSAANGVPTANSGWVEFPAGEGLMTGLPNEASFEIWVVWTGGPVWQEMFDFGQASTPGISLGGGQYVMLCPYDGANGLLRAEWDQNPAYDVTLQGPVLEANVLSQVVYTHDQDRQLDKLYRNGVLVASAQNTGLWSTLPDTDNWMARDEWQDPMFQGSYVDFRFWNGALTAGQVANLYNSGPEVIAGPALQITASGSSVTLKWPANATAFTLQSTTDLGTQKWTTVSATPTVVNGLNVLTVPASQTATFYRLSP